MKYLWCGVFAFSLILPRSLFSAERLPSPIKVLLRQIFYNEVPSGRSAGYVSHLYLHNPEAFVAAVDESKAYLFRVAVENKVHLSAEKRSRDMARALIVKAVDVQPPIRIDDCIKIPALTDDIIMLMPSLLLRGLSTKSLSYWQWFHQLVMVLGKNVLCLPDRPFGACKDSFYDYISVLLKILENGDCFGDEDRISMQCLIDLVDVGAFADHIIAGLIYQVDSVLSYPVIDRLKVCSCCEARTLSSDLLRSKQLAGDLLKKLRAFLNCKRALVDS